MATQELKSAFTWETRRVVIEDRVWHFPDYYDDQDFTFPGWDHPSLFGNHNPVKIEYCSGNGAWIFERAKQEPGTNWVAVEKQFGRVRQIWSRMKKAGMTNLIIVCGEGCRWTKLYIPDNSVEQAFVNFPDPWPKGRHAKHRIVKPDFSEEMGRILKPGGSITLVTDDPAYSGQMIDVFLHTKGFTSLYQEPYYAANVPGYGKSFFEELWKGKGRTIRTHQFKK